MRDSSTARSNCSGRSAKPEAISQVRPGMNSAARPEISSSAATSIASDSSASAWAGPLPSRVRVAANSGRKAAVKAPSANSERNRLGSRNATKKASASGPAPRMRVISVSRMKPATRDTMVMPPTVAMARAKLMAAGSRRGARTAAQRLGRRLVADVGQRRQQGGADLVELRLVRHLQPEHVLHIEDVDRRVAIGRDLRRGDLQRQLRQAARHLIEEARPVVAVDL